MNLPLGGNFFFHETDFRLRQVVEVGDEAVDPAVGGIDLTLQVRPFVVRPGGGEPPVKGEHLLGKISSCLFCRRRQS